MENEEKITSEQPAEEKARSGTKLGESEKIATENADRSPEVRTEADEAADERTGDSAPRQRAVGEKINGCGTAIKRFFGYFTLYEKIWFSAITVLAFTFAFLFPEEDVGGVNGKLIMALYLADIFLNIACELLISKQSKWNFIVSLAVEVTEIAICIVCMYRFATMAVTLFFWIPIDIISFVMWNKRKDEAEPELTEVRKLKWWQDIILVAAVAVWTIVVGYLLTLIESEEGVLSYSEWIYDIAAYLDALASAVGIANGVFILLRYREQWIAWYIVAIIETIINIMAGQWVLLILKAGYLTNTTYGYIKWTKYIKSRSPKPDQSSLVE